MRVMRLEGTLPQRLMALERCHAHKMTWGVTSTAAVAVPLRFLCVNIRPLCAPQLVGEMGWEDRWMQHSFNGAATMRCREVNEL